MKEKIKAQKRFIRYPLLIAIVIIGILIIGGGGYITIKQYRNYQTKQAERAKQSQEQLEKAQQEIEVLKQKQTEQENKPPQIIVKETIKELNTQEISTTDISSFIDGVVSIQCSSDKGRSFGSGSLWKFNDDYYILTNKHVLNENPIGTICKAEADKPNSDAWGWYDIREEENITWNNIVDAIAVKIRMCNISESQCSTYGWDLDYKQLNYKLTSLRKCPEEMPLNSPVVIIGYPAFSMSSGDDYKGGKWFIVNRTITNGIISAYETHALWLQNPYKNYYVSAKIDSGNSGGIVLSKDKNGMCVLGIPTWLQVGNYDIQGIIQNIHNIFSTKDM